MPVPTGLHHVVHADDRDADYDVDGVEWLGEPVYLNPNTQKLTFEGKQKITLYRMEKSFFK